MASFSLQRRLFLLHGLLFGLSLGDGECAAVAIRQGLHRKDGELLVDGHPVGLGAVIQPGSTVVTVGGQAVIVIGEDAFLLGENTDMLFHSGATKTLPRKNANGTHPGIKGFTLNSGKVLSVFSPGPRTLKIPTAVIGVRGTGIFLQVEPEKDYVCLCYGRVDIRMNNNPAVKKTIRSRYHASRFLAADASIRKAPMIGHTDAELVMLEALVNRKPPF